MIIIKYIYLHLKNSRVAMQPSCIDILALYVLNREQERCSCIEIRSSLSWIMFLTRQQIIIMIHSSILQNYFSYDNKAFYLIYNKDIPSDSLLGCTNYPIYRRLWFSFTMEETDYSFQHSSEWYPEWLNQK